jgi:phosphoadenosine phosphosulfate reductase
LLVENTLFGVRDKVKIAIDRLRTFEPPEGYYLAFSGGKDSQCIYHLAKEAGVKFDAHYHITTVDPPELIYFIRKNYVDVIYEKPKMTMWRLIEKKQMPPTRMTRYCCEVLKEGGGIGRVVITGVRWAESNKRRNNRATYELLPPTLKNKKLMNDNDEARRIFETCYRPGKDKRIVNPIIDWEDDDVWEYLNSRKIPYCDLYNKGWKRLGCIGCPLTNAEEMQKELDYYPKYKDNYMRAFEKMLERRKESGKDDSGTRWETAEGVMKAWIKGATEEKPMEGQLDMTDLYDDD